jgi:hypothetical protein
MVHVMCALAVFWAWGPQAWASESQTATQRMQHAWQAHLQATAKNDAAGSDRELQRLIQHMEDSGWPGAWAYGESLAQQADAQPIGARGLALAVFATRLAPHRPTALWALGRQQLGNGVIVDGLATVGQAWGAGGPPGHLFAMWLVRPMMWTIAALTWAICLHVGVQLRRLGPQLAHDLGHRMPSQFRPAVNVLAGLGLVFVFWVVPLGPLPWAACILAALAPYQNAVARRGSAWACALGAVALLVAPYLLVPLQQPATSAGARYYALQDATATWARDRLPPVPQAKGLDLWAWAMLARYEGDMAASNALGRQAVAQGITTPELFTLLGNLQWEQKDYEGAKSTYGFALDHDPHDSIARFNLSQALLSLARPVEAEKARSQAFTEGGPAMVAQAAQAQKRGHLLVEPVISPKLLQHTGCDAADGLLHAAQQAAIMPFTGIIPPRAAVAILLFVSWCSAAWAVFAQVSPQVIARLPVPQWTRRCTRCHTLSCPRCSPEAAEAGLCALCRQAALGADDAGIALRTQQERKAMQHYHLSQGFKRVGGIFWPGLDLLIGGRLVSGLALSTATGLVVALGLTRAQILPDVFPLWGPPAHGLGQAVGLGIAGLALLLLWSMRRLFGPMDPS